MSLGRRICAALAALCVVTAAGCNPGNTYVPPPPPVVSVAKPVERPVTEYLEFTGTTRAVATVELKARVNGFLQQIAFQDGAYVEEGDLLFVIDKAPYTVELESARANLKKAQSVLQLKEAQHRRTKDLVRLNAASKEALDVEMAERESAAADVATAETVIRRAELNLNYTEIRAPLAGRIGRRQLDVGDLVRGEESLLATIESVNPIHAYFTLSETDLLRYLEGSKDQITSPMENPPVFELALGDSGEYRFSGRLDFKEFGVDAASGTVTRRAIFSNEDQALVPGLFVRVRSKLGEPKPRLLVEERAIGFDQRGAFLLVVNDKNVIEYRLVKLGALDAGMRVIDEGVASADSVVVNGLQRARPGATVNPQVVPMGEAITARLQSTSTMVSARASGTPSK